MLNLPILAGLVCSTLALPSYHFPNEIRLRDSILQRQICSTPHGYGRCESTTSCAGLSVPGFCPGPAEFQCCVGKPVPRAPASTPSPGSGGAVVSAASSQIGVPYVWGGGGCAGESNGGFDCSGLTQYSVCKGAGKTIPRTAQTQYDATSMGTAIPVGSIQPGDLVFWGQDGNCDSAVDHTAVVVSSTEIIAAPETGQDVQQQTLWHSSGGLELCPNAMRFW